MSHYKIQFSPCQLAKDISGKASTKQAEQMRPVIMQNSPVSQYYGKIFFQTWYSPLKPFTRFTDHAYFYIWFYVSLIGTTSNCTKHIAYFKDSKSNIFLKNLLYKKYTRQQPVMLILWWGGGAVIIFKIFFLCEANTFIKCFFFQTKIQFISNYMWL